jgi:hypothetical protein
MVKPLTKTDAGAMRARRLYPDARATSLRRHSRAVMRALFALFR